MPSLPPILSAAKAQFFAVVLRNTITDNELLIPSDFLRRHGESLSTHALIDLPCGSEWKMELRRSDDGLVWLSKGWQDFAAHYSVQFGHFIVFRYRGNSRFSASIFDTTTVEIDYPMDDESVEILEEFPSSSSRPRKKSRTESIGQTRVDLTRPSPSSKPQLSCRTSRFSSEHPYFVSRVYPHIFPQRVPNTFGRTYFDYKHRIATLKIGTKSWSAKVLVTKSGRLYSLVGLECDAFATDNSLQHGDVCVYELIDIDLSILRVTIFQAQVTVSPGSERPIDDVPSSPSKLLPVNPCFEVQCTQNYLSQLRVPLRFSRIHFQQGRRRQLVTLTVENKIDKWPVKLTGNLSRALSTGWQVFVKDNNVGPGDSCIFELVSAKSDDAVLKVSIKRKNPNLSCFVQSLE